MVTNVDAGGTDLRVTFGDFKPTVVELNNSFPPIKNLSYIRPHGRTSLFFFFVFCPVSLFCPSDSPLHVGYISSLYGQQILFLFQRKRFRGIPVFGHPIHGQRRLIYTTGDRLSVRGLDDGPSTGYVVRRPVTCSWCSGVRPSVRTSGVFVLPSGGVRPFVV